MSHYRTQKKEKLFNDLTIFFEKAFNALFSRDRHRQTTQKRHRFEFILHRRHDARIILKLLSLLLLLVFFLHRRHRRAIFHHLIVKLSLDFDSFDFENVQQLLIFNFEETKSILRCFRSFFRLSQKISKMFHLRVRDICSMMNYVTDDVNHVMSLTSLFHFLLHANDTTIEFVNNDEQSFVIVVDQVLIDHLIEDLNRFFLNVAKATRYLFFY